MIEQFPERWGERLRTTARAFPYPPTPDIAGAVRRRLSAQAARPALAPRQVRWAWAVAVVAFLLAGLLAVPEVRAGLVKIIQVGIVRIFLVTPTPSATPAPTGTVAATGIPRPTPTPTPTMTPLRSVLDNLAGETTLAEAQAKVQFRMLLPTYPADLGPPDRVFLQDQGAPALILVWVDPEHPDQVRLSLHELAPGGFGVEKFQPRVIQETTVNGQQAVWTEGPYLLRFRNGDIDSLRLVQGHVLIWSLGDITYRLETGLSLEEAVRIAESLK